MTKKTRIYALWPISIPSYGQDKGYDVFVEVAKQLVKIRDNIQFLMLWVILMKK